MKTKCYPWHVLLGILFNKYLHEKDEDYLRLKKKLTLAYYISILTRLVP